VNYDQVPLFPADRRQHIHGRKHRKQKVRAGHRRRGPECDQPTHVQRMTHVAVEQRCAEFDVPVRFARKIQRHLPQAEQIKVASA
jgi:hypothetical protein